MITASNDEREKGRELKANELKPKTVILLQSSKRPNDYATLWVSKVGQDFVVFSAGELKMMLLCGIREDGAIVDNAGTVLRVYEYLGEV